MDARAFPVLLAVSLTPGLCMMLALTLGATIGVRRSLFMMIGELGGLALVSIVSITGVSALMLARPEIHTFGRIVGGAYLLWIGARIACTDLPLRIEAAGSSAPDLNPARLVVRGFLAAVGNPKSWLFYASLLPPLLHGGTPFPAQVIALVTLLLAVELISLLLYAWCGRAARGLLRNEALARLFFVIAGGVVSVFGLQVLFVQ